MYLGKLVSWGLLAPFVVLLWVVGAAGVAYADTSTDPTTTSTANSQEDAAALHASIVAATHASSTSAAGSTATQPAAEDTTSPQPISTADSNAGGANGQCPGGPYCSTRDGSASGNGSGTGKAVGEPCAGCVGKADNKNPQGQMPNGSDANAGYECDTNHGIGQTNPAHTGCVPPTQQCVPTETVPCVPPTECVPSDTPCVSPPECVPTAGNPCVQTPQAAPPATTVSPPQRTLPNTGAPSDLPWLAATALVSLMAGTTLLVRRRHLMR